MTRKKTASTLTRREALAAGGVAAAVTIVPRHVLGAAGVAPPSEKPVLGAIGVGGVGYSQVQSCDKAGFHVAALCDVDDVYAKKAYDRWPDARRYRDFRDLLAEEDDRIDAVYCGTPDHTHALVAMAALRRGKHLCCVKPLTRTMGELRRVVDQAKEAGVATQVTTSPNTTETGCRTCELIWNGVIGDIHELHVWSNRPFWPQGMARPDGADPVPDSLDWDLWLGPAAKRPFKQRWPADSLPVQQIKYNYGVNRREGYAFGAVYHPWNFRGWWDFGTGALGDMGCHHMNTPYRVLKLGSPSEISASATRVFDESAPLASIVTYDFGERDEMPPVRVVWYDGGLQPPRPHALKDAPLPQDGVIYVGDKGVLLADWGGIKLFPTSLEEAARRVPRTLERRDGTWGEWYQAVTGGPPAGAHFESAEPNTEFVLLGVLAQRTGKPLTWDATMRRVTNAEEVNAWVDPPYENGWSLDAM